jgi:hypothetical protein
VSIASLVEQRSPCSCGSRSHSRWQHLRGLGRLDSNGLRLNYFTATTAAAAAASTTTATAQATADQPREVLLSTTVSNNDDDSNHYNDNASVGIR